MYCSQTRVYSTLDSGLTITYSGVVCASLHIAKRSWDRAFACAICRSSHMSSGDTDDWIGMPFGVVSGVGLGMGVLDFGGDRRRGRGSLG